MSLFTKRHSAEASAADVPPPVSTLRRRSLDEHLFSPGPKRILTLDGGGVRGILSIQFVKRIEETLRARFGGSPDFRLSDYFDMFAGTSTGAIIATGLAMGRSADELDQLYRELAPKVFGGTMVRLFLGRSRFSHRQLLRLLKREFGDATLDSDRLLSGLSIVSKRVDTGSAWVLTNNSRNPFWKGSIDRAKPRIGNARYPLASVVRASTAAPYYFEPQRIRIFDGNKALGLKPEDGLFLDGGVTGHNNPALMALQVAVLDGHKLKWSVGADQLQIVSIGTGTWRRRVDVDYFESRDVLTQTKEALTGMIADAERNILLTMQWMSRSHVPWHINSEVGDLRLDHLGDAPLFTFQRYDVELEAGKLDIPVPARRLARLQDMADTSQLALLGELGRRAAAVQVKPGHFETHFDPA